MKTRLTQLFFAFVLFGAMDAIEAQNVAFERSNFPNDKKGYKDAVNNIETGDSYFYNGDYTMYIAIDYYLKANTFNPNNAQLNFKLGRCYLNSPNKYKSLDFLTKAYSLDPNVDPHITLYLAEAYHLNHDFDNAIKYYNLYRAVPDKLEDINPDKRITECNEGKKLIANPARVIIENMGPVVNSKYREYAAVISADEAIMFFTSRRDNTTGKLIADDGMYFEDIYTTTKQNNIWTPPIALPSPINGKEHDATVALSNDGQKLFIYSDDGNNKGDILISRLEGDRWSKPESAGGRSINTEFSEIHACFSYDEKAIYFVSNKPDGSLGGFDIYVTRLGADGKWQAAENLGPAINTPYDEDAVFMHPDGKSLYFSSKGHKTMGSFDIFKSVYENGRWSEPENLGYPINSADKDAFFVVSASGKHGYYASAKMDAIGETDIYRITLLGPEKDPILATEDQLLLSSSVTFRDALTIETKDTKSKLSSNVTILKGIVVDALSKTPLEAMIVITDNEKNEVVATFQSNSKSGKYLISLPSGRNYGIAVTLEDYLFYSENIDLPASKTYQEIDKDIELSKLEVGQKIVLRNIFYDFNKSSLRDQSISELDRLTKLLETNPAMRIEISSHTDNVGSAAYNEKLSLSRAESVVDYLVNKKGIKKERLEFKGYGFTQPIAPNDTDQGRQLNRRTEFKILSK
ncbi:MAG: OmpA family protein [Bacteroidia bacterium]|jgi:outer membrane protein OmpA-like peptidoglycan-associated protein